MGNTCSLRSRPSQERTPVAWPATTVTPIHEHAKLYVPPACDTAPETLQQTEVSST